MEHIIVIFDGQRRLIAKPPSYEILVQLGRAYFSIPSTAGLSLSYFPVVAPDSKGIDLLPDQYHDVADCTYIIFSLVYQPASDRDSINDPAKERQDDWGSHYNTASNYKAPVTEAYTEDLNESSLLDIHTPKAEATTFVRDHENDERSHQGPSWYEAALKNTSRRTTSWCEASRNTWTPPLDSPKSSVRDDGWGDLIGHGSIQGADSRKGWGWGEPSVFDQKHSYKPEVLTPLSIIKQHDAEVRLIIWVESEPDLQPVIFKIRPSSKVKELKTLIAAKLGYEMDWFYLLADHEELRESSPIARYQVKDGTVIYVEFYSSD